MSTFDAVQTGILLEARNGIETSRQGIADDLAIFSDTIGHEAVPPIKILTALIACHVSRQELVVLNHPSATLAGEILVNRLAEARVDDEAALREYMKTLKIPHFAPLGRLNAEAYNTTAWKVAAPLVQQEVALVEVQGIMSSAGPA